MIDYIKNLDKDALLAKAKPLGIAGLCFVAVFVAGFGVGKSSSSPPAESAAKRSLNYTTSGQTNSNASQKNDSQAKTPSTAKPKAGEECYIKGSKGKIYHMPDGSFYERTNPAECFNSEEEAQAAGYKKSSR